MVSLTEIYNVKESVFNKIVELKSDRDPARGNKGKSDAKDYYLVPGDPDPETGAIKSKVIYKRSVKRMVADLEAEAIDMKKLSEDNPDDIVLYNLSEELKELFNKFRTHARKNYELDEMSTTGTGASISTGNSMAYATPKAFKKKRKDD